MSRMRIRNKTTGMHVWTIWASLLPKHEDLRFKYTQTAKQLYDSRIQKENSFWFSEKFITRKDKTMETRLLL